MSTKTNEQFLTPEQLAKRWQVSRGTLYAKLSRGEEMPKRFKLGNYIRFKLSDVEAFERKRTQ